MRALRNILWLFTILLPCYTATAQTTQVNGQVTDAESGAPLPGVNIIVKGTTTGTISDIDGHYEVQVSSSADTLVFSFIGYETQEIPVGGRSVIDVVMGMDVEALEEVVVVGYGTQEKVSLTGSVASVDIEELDKRPVASVTEALQGISPGLTVIDRGGRPGDDGTMFFVRGRGTLNSTDPLVLIDGVEGDISALNPNDIASISVLKDAASAAIYGSRAANGVILVTTRHGANTGGIQIAYDGYYGMQSVAHFPERVGIEDYIRLINEAHVNAGLEPKYSEEYIQKTLSGEEPLKYPDTDWLGVLFNPAPIQDHSLRLSGGSDLATYSLSLNYMDQDGMIPNTAADRYGLRLNTDFQPSKRLDTGVNIALRRTSNVEPHDMGGVLFRMFHDTPPMVVAKYPDGTYGWSDNGHNPLAYAEASGQRTRTYLHGRIDARADYEILDGLSVRTLAALQAGNWSYEDWENEVIHRDYWDPTVINKVRSPNGLWQRKSNDTEVYLRGLLEYDKTFGAHGVTAMIGYDQTAHYWEEIRASREGFYNNELQEINVGDEAREDTWGTSEEWRLRSGFGRLNYSFRDRYLFEVNARYDGSSRFSEGHRYGFFPSLSAGWRISEEPFMQNVGWINELKLRGSWGKMGNQDIGLYRYWALINLGHNYVFGGELVNGAAKTDLANDLISWETTTMSDIGLDLELFDGRLAFTGDIYRKDTDGILLELPIPAVIGLDAPTQNAGKVRNTGWETALTWRDVPSSDLFYSLGINFSYNKNEVIDLAGTGPYIDGRWLTAEGHPLGTMYGWEADGLFQTQAEVDAHAQQHPWTGPGDIRFVDQNSDGVIDHQDKVVMGLDMPPYLFGSTLAASFKGIDASVFFQGALGVDTYLEGALVEGPYWENYTTVEWLDRWTPENPDGFMPKPALRRWHNHQINSYWVRDASYVKLKNAQIGYTLPQSVTQRFGTDRLRIYLSGQNLLTFSGVSFLLDPEFPSGRGTVYPQTRTISLGASLTF